MRRRFREGDPNETLKRCRVMVGVQNVRTWRKRTKRTKWSSKHLPDADAEDKHAERPDRAQDGPQSVGRWLAGVNRQLSVESPLVGGPRFAAGDIAGQVWESVQDAR